MRRHYTYVIVIILRVIPVVNLIYLGTFILKNHFENENLISICLNLILTTTLSIIVIYYTYISAMAKFKEIFILKILAGC